MKSIKLLLLLLFGFSAVMADQGSYYEEQFMEANELYKQNKYDEAYDIYQKIYGSGYESASLLYNLGNTYFKLGNVPKAILFYERALKLEPKDRDVEYNLKLANEMLIDKLVKIPPPFFTKMLNTTSLSAPLFLWEFLVILSAFVALILFGLFIWTSSSAIKRAAFYGMFIFLLFFVVFYTLGRDSYKQNHQLRFAIILEPSLTIKNGPTQNATDLFVIHEGLKVEILSNQEDWMEIRLEDGKLGWTKNYFLEEI